MAADDYYTHLARQQLQRLDASKAQTLADLATAKANSDYDSAGLAVQELADIEAKRSNLVALHDQYVRSQTSAEPPELTQEEKHARPWDRMNYGDVWEMSQNSKYGCDPEAFKAGMLEVQRRRAKGE
jgi:hypothetical protein